MPTAKRYSWGVPAQARREEREVLVVLAHVAQSSVDAADRRHPDLRGDVVWVAAMACWWGRRVKYLSIAAARHADAELQLVNIPAARRVKPTLSLIHI